VLVRRNGAIDEAPNAKLYSSVIAEGDAFYLRSGGGGGFGSPLKRPLEKVLDDVRGGYITADSARRYYGVVIDPEMLTVDETATAALRRRISESAPPSPLPFRPPARRLTPAQRAEREPNHPPMACLLPACCGGRAHMWQALAVEMDLHNAAAAADATQRRPVTGGE
jgi:hypothetical protein